MVVEVIKVATLWNVISAKIILLYYKVKCCKGRRFLLLGRSFEGGYFSSGALFRVVMSLWKAVYLWKACFSGICFHSYPFP